MLIESFPGLIKLSPKEKLQLASELWSEALLKDLDDPALKELLDHRLREFEENPDNVIPHQEVLARINLRKWRGHCASALKLGVDETIEDIRGR